MSNMEILTTNYLNTTTLVSVESGTDTVDRLFNRNTDNNYYESSGYNTNTMGVTIGVTFVSSRSISRIVLQGINLKYFTIYYNSNSANTFTLVDAPTTVSDWLQNSETALYLKFDTISVDSVWIVATQTMSEGYEKQISQFWINGLKFVFENNPDSKGYQPKLNSKEVIHEMSDGGSTKYVFGDAFEAGIKLDYQSQDMYDNFFSLYRERNTFVFTPFPTGTSWEGNHIYEVNWAGDFDFLQPAGNNWREIGYNGELKVKEVPR
jgi:hypothetical protein